LSLLTEELKNLCLRLGADLVGIASMDRFEKAPGLHNPRSHMPYAESVIVIGLRYPLASVKLAGRPPSCSIASYMWYQEVMDWKMSSIAYDVTRYIENRGYEALPLPPRNLRGPERRLKPFERSESSLIQYFSHQHAAVAAGLGEYGWSGLVLTPAFGPRQRFLSILTDAPLEPDPMYEGPKLCDREKCGLKCVDLCPLKAISKDEYVTVVVGGREYSYGKLDRRLCAQSKGFTLSTGEWLKYWSQGAGYVYRAVGLSPMKAATDGLKDARYHFGFLGLCMVVCKPEEEARKEDPEYFNTYRRLHMELNAPRNTGR